MLYLIIKGKNIDVAIAWKTVKLNNKCHEFVQQKKSKC